MHKLGQALQRERGKNLFLLGGILIHNLIYPLSIGGSWQPILFYIVFCALFVVGVYTLSSYRLERIFVTIASAAVFIFGLSNSYNPGTFAQPLLYVFAIFYHVVMLIVLVRYIFVAERVLLEVILAATSLYLVIGSTFTPIFGLIEYIEPGSFVASSGADIGWQQLLYYSYVTLTTLGYGDITPVKFYAQSFASFEAVVGVLYTVILLSRLVSLYEAERQQSTLHKPPTSLD